MTLLSSSMKIVRQESSKSSSFYSLVLLTSGSTNQDSVRAASEKPLIFFGSPSRATAEKPFGTWLSRILFSTSAKNALRWIESFL